jgi:Fe2+ or Zn2+ uptake regulation protein
MSEEQLLKQAGFSLTKPRKLVLAFLRKTKKLVAANDIYQKLKKDLDKVTVYRTLEVLEKAQIIFKETGDKEAKYYLADKQHHHIVCQKCGYTQCLPCEHIFTKIKNFSKIKHQLFLTGLCNKCK